MFLFQEVSTQKLCSLVVTRTSMGTFAISNHSLVLITVYDHGKEATIGLKNNKCFSLFQ